MATATAQLQDFLQSLEKALFNEQGSPEGDTEFGIIESYKDGVVQISGLSNLKMGEVVSIQGTDVQALVMNLDRDEAYAVVLQSGGGVKEGMFVESNGQTLSIPVGDAIVGRVVDSLGEPVDGNGEIKAKERNPHEVIAPGVMSRKSVDTPVQTGILAIDALIPVGRGQRELIIGDRQTGKTAIAIDTILNQADQDMICVYVGIGQREGKMAQVVENLRERGAMDYTIVVDAPAASSAVMQFLAPYAGSAIAEYFLKQGKDVLVIYDDLSKQAVAYREMSLLLRRPPGREAYPGDVFYIHSRLLERAVNLNEEYGGGSITALPIIETQAGDVSAYIPTNVISITDGQIFLQSDLFYKGIRPAIDVGISVSRVGGSAQTKIMKKVSGTAKLDLAQYYELEAFSQFASELDDSTKQQLTRGKRVVEALKQDQYAPYKLWEEVVVLYSATHGYLDKIEEEEVEGKLKALRAHIETSEKGFVKKVMMEKHLSEEVEVEMKGILDAFFK
jgi:F-type H+/Na+-transporting ATPase subunit alpha